ncbi:MAG: hypothetical protein HY898_32570 [Deltaproteobacteria bacterium]|nr:hypothetical protein [Deltaproteobacteria bacterium]
MGRSHPSLEISAVALVGLLLAQACSSAALTDSPTPPTAGAAGSAGGDGGNDAQSDTGSGGSSGSVAEAGPDAPADAAQQADSAPDSPGDAPEDTAANYLLPPSTACGPVDQGWCASSPVTTVLGSMRKDWSLPKSAYNEPVDPPTHGGRLHVAAIAAVPGKVTTVTVDGLDAKAAIAAKKLEWFHVWPSTAVAGEPIWVSLHSRDASYDPPTSVQISIATSSGTAVDGSFDASPTPVPLTYVTTTDDLGSLLIHVHNYDTNAHHLKRLLVDGRDATSGACIADKEIAAGDSALWIVPLCKVAKAGDPWTVVAEYADAAAAVGVGRVLRPDFPIETWNSTSDCPFSYPGSNQASHDNHVAAGFDTLFFHGGTGNSCATDQDSFKMLEALAQAGGDMRLLPTDDLMRSPHPLLSSTASVSGVFTGDEVDGEVYDGNGLPKPAGEADTTTAVWERYPHLPTYIGGKTNNNIGTFAGVADVQGVDFYVAACAPHITQWGTHPPLRAAYDYLANARRNQMPLPTWLYAQGLSTAWNKSGALGTVHVQPDPQEILVQAFFVPAAGAKGMMWFQTNQPEASHKPERWNAISRANRMIRGVRPWLRAGDPTGGALADADTIAEVIRSQEALVVPVINLKSTSGPTDINCAGGSLLSEAAVPHWQLADAAPDVVVKVPADFGVADVFEVGEGGVSDLPAAPVVQGRTMTLSAVKLTNANPARLFVFASGPEVRAKVVAAMQP